MSKKFSLKERPVAQGVVSNAIFQVVWNGASAVIGIIAGHFASIRGIAPHWAILIGAVVFFLLALTYNLLVRKQQTRSNDVIAADNEGSQSVKESDGLGTDAVTVEKYLSCPYEWSHQIIENQRTGIEPFVLITECAIRGLHLTRTVPCVEFSFTIRNASIFNITIEDRLVGAIEFDVDKHVFAGPMLITHNGVKNCLQGNTGRFDIQLRLSKEEAALIEQSATSPTTRPDEAAFLFDRVFITIIGADPSKRVEPRRFNIAKLISPSGICQDFYRH